MNRTKLMPSPQFMANPTPRRPKKGENRKNAQKEGVIPKANESILQNTKLFQAQPKTVPDKQPDIEAEGDPWQGLTVKKVPLNRHIQLSYISEDSLKILVERFHKIQTKRQQKFRHIIHEMRQDEKNAPAYSSLITDAQEKISYNILFLNFSRYIKSLFHPPTRRILQMAHLVYPQGTLMQWAFEKLQSHTTNENDLEFQTKFGFTVSLLSALDEYHCSVFLVGGTSASLNRVENNFKLSFDNIKILGRYTQKYCKTKHIEQIRTLINKSAPVLLLVASTANIHDFMDEKRSEQKMKPFLILDYPQALKEFSGKHRDKNQSVSRFMLGMGYLIFPWKWPQLLCVLIFLLKIFFASIAHKK